MILHTKYQGSMHCGLRQKDCFIFLPILVYVKHVTRGRGGIIGTNLDRGPLGDATYQISRLYANLNKLDRSLLGDASYQISRLLALWYQTRRFFMVLPIYM